MVIWSANNNHSGCFPPVRFSAVTAHIHTLFLSFAPLADLRSGRCIATRIDLSLYPVGHEEASQPRARHDRSVRLEDGRHAEDRREKLKSKKDRVTQRGAEGAGEQRRRTRDDRCDKGWRKRTRSEENEKDVKRKRESNKRDGERSESIEERSERGKREGSLENAHGRTENDRKYRRGQGEMCARKATSQVRLPLSSRRRKTKRSVVHPPQPLSSGLPCSPRLLSSARGSPISRTPNPPTLILRLVAVADSCRTAM